MAGGRIVSYGYNDWFLPSKDELYLIYTNLHLNGYGNFMNATNTYGLYYSSTEYDFITAWRLQFYSGFFGHYDKGSVNGSIYHLSGVRAIRAF